jgi:hypothetical protein
MRCLKSSNREAGGFGCSCSGHERTGGHPALMHTSHEARRMGGYYWPMAMGPGLEYWSP